MTLHALTLCAPIAPLPGGTCVELLILCSAMTVCSVSKYRCGGGTAITDSMLGQAAKMRSILPQTQQNEYKSSNCQNKNCLTKRGAPQSTKGCTSIHCQPLPTKLFSQPFSLQSLPDPIHLQAISPKSLSLNHADMNLPISVTAATDHCQLTTDKLKTLPNSFPVAILRLKSLLRRP
jgi:hypothetical protein